MRFTVYSNINADIAVSLADRADKAGHKVAERIREDTSPYVPFLNGVLDRGTRVVGNEVIYPPPYARYLYYGKAMEGNPRVVTDRNLVFTKTFHPQAQAFWFEASKAQNMDKWLRVAEKAVNNG